VACCRIDKRLAGFNSIARRPVTPARETGSHTLDASHFHSAGTRSLASVSRFNGFFRLYGHGRVIEPGDFHVRRTL
jgi:hypothetical protein